MNERYKILIKSQKKFKYNFTYYFNQSIVNLLYSSHNIVLEHLEKKNKCHQKPYSNKNKNFYSTLIEINIDRNMDKIIEINVRRFRVQQTYDN